MLRVVAIELSGDHRRCGVKIHHAQFAWFRLGIKRNPGLRQYPRLYALMVNP